jgi:hypothetical protein
MKTHSTSQWDWLDIIPFEGQGNTTCMERLIHDGLREPLVGLPGQNCTRGLALYIFDVTK